MTDSCPAECPVAAKTSPAKSSFQSANHRNSECHILKNIFEKTKQETSDCFRVFVTEEKAVLHCVTEGNKTWTTSYNHSLPGDNTVRKCEIRLTRQQRGIDWIRTHQCKGLTDAVSRSQRERKVGVHRWPAKPPDTITRLEISVGSVDLFEPSFVLSVKNKV